MADYKKQVKEDVEKAIKNKSPDLKEKFSIEYRSHFYKDAGAGRGHEEWANGGKRKGVEDKKY